MQTNSVDTLRDKYPFVKDIYFECGDGWYWILDFAFRCILNYEKHRSYEGYHPVKIVQVKEKFGSLRIYRVGGDDYIVGIIDFAESLSAKFCEVCGEKGKLTKKKYWLKTLCDNHREKDND